MTDPRQANADFPYGWPGKSVCYIHVSDSGEVKQMSLRGDMREYLANPTGRLFAAWPGQWSTDLFAIDPSVLAAALGIEVSA